MYPFHHPSRHITCHILTAHSPLHTSLHIPQNSHGTQESPNPHGRRCALHPYTQKQSQVPRGARRWGFRGPPPPSGPLPGEWQSKKNKKCTRPGPISRPSGVYGVLSPVTTEASPFGKKGPGRFFISRIGWLGFSASAVPLGSLVPCWCVLYPFLLG